MDLLVFGFGVSQFCILDFKSQDSLSEFLFAPFTKNVSLLWLNNKIFTEFCLIVWFCVIFSLFIYNLIYSMILFRLICCFFWFFFTEIWLSSQIFFYRKLNFGIYVSALYVYIHIFIFTYDLLLNVNHCKLKKLISI